jgi:hypothetical protein
MVGSYAASTMPTIMVRTYYVQNADCPVRAEDRVALCRRQIDLEKRPGRPGDDASPLGERVTTGRVILTGADATLAANPGRSPEGVNNS